MKTLGIGMVGARYGARLHWANYVGLAEGMVELRGVCARTRASAESFARDAQVGFVTDDLDALLARTDIDVVDICTEPASHHELAIRVARAGKHIIIEKPLTGYFGAPGDAEPIGHHVPKARMRAAALANARAVQDAVQASGVTLCYAENWLYAPPIVKLRKLVAASQGAILSLRAEENHSGSGSTMAREWKSAGGGALLRMGVHAVGACLHIKHWEGELRQNRPIRPVSVVADVADLVHTPASERARAGGAHRWIMSSPVDVETWADVVIAFDDGTRATVTVHDTGLGGLNTRVSAYMTDGVIKVNMTQNDAVETFSPEPAAFGDERFPERLETRAGWNRPSCDDDWFRGFSQELNDFVIAIRTGRQPLSGIQLAVDCVDVIYGAYVSAEEGRRVSLG
jgi:predicted dehydrogenase